MGKQMYFEETHDEASLTRSSTHSSTSTTQVVGTTDLYNENGQIRYVPMPTPDPKDPLNLTNWRKIVAVTAICFFGALALSAEIIIGALIPVFALEYAGVDPKILGSLDIGALSPPGVVNLNPLGLLAMVPGAQPLWKVSLLASLPLLTNGISTYFLVPVSIAVGRRPVLLFCGVLAFVGGYWAGLSNSLESHIIARCVQAVGAGAVEALIPLIVQDMVFIHQRNTAMSAIWGTQGLIIVSLGIGSPLIVANLGWRYLYYITSSFAVVAWIGLLVCLPETRWTRSTEELNGKPVYYLHPGETRPRQDAATYGRRTAWTNFGVFQNGFEFKLAGWSMIDTLRTMVFPNILWVILLNSMFISIQNAAGQVGSTVLIAEGWKFRTLGLAVVPIVVATPFVWLFGGYLADKVSNYVARRNGGRREPEAHLLNLILPIILGVTGSLLFGYAAQHVKVVHWSVLLAGIFCIALGFLTTNTVLAVYIVESYPQWAGPVLVNVASWRCIIGFAMSFRATTWVEQLGFLRSFGIYAGVLGGIGLFLPVIFFYGKAIRKWTSGSIKTRHTNDQELAAVEKKGSYMEY